MLLALDDKLAPLDDVCQNRICAFLSERLLNFQVWHRKLKLKELDWCMTEDMVQASDTHQRRRSARKIARDTKINAGGGSTTWMAGTAVDGWDHMIPAIKGIEVVKH